MDEIIETYKKTIDDTLKDIYRILEHDLEYDIKIDKSEIPLQFKKVLDLSCENIVKKWSLGKKYVRTLFVKQAFPDYPKDILKLSLSIDVIINLLDDLLDEEIKEKDKALYIIELIRAFSIYSHHKFEENLQEAVSSYFNKIISIAVSENIYKELIEKEDKPENILAYSEKVYNCRSLDMDIFIEVPLLTLYGNLKKESTDKILKIGRVFRSLNLIKKDIIDIDHDRRNKIGTAMVLLFDKGSYYKDTVRKLSDIYMKKAELISVEPQLEKIRNNFYEMIKNEKKGIEEYLNRL